jgi:hypothetical protein
MPEWQKPGVLLGFESRGCWWELTHAQHGLFTSPTHYSLYYRRPLSVANLRYGEGSFATSAQEKFGINTPLNFGIPAHCFLNQQGAWPTHFTETIAGQEVM